MMNERSAFATVYNSKKFELAKKKEKIFKQCEIFKFDLAPEIKYEPGMAYTSIEPHMLHRESSKLRWMRYMWAFSNAQVLKEVDLSMHLKISRTSNLVLNYYRSMGECLQEFTKGYHELSPILDLPPIEAAPKLFRAAEDREQLEARNIRKKTFFGSMRVFPEFPLAAE